MSSLGVGNVDITSVEKFFVQLFLLFLKSFSSFCVLYATGFLGLVSAQPKRTNFEQQVHFQDSRRFDATGSRLVLAT